jgi:hypothetical protein
MTKKPCKTCYDTGVYYEPIGPDGELLQPMVCPCQSRKDPTEEEVVPNAR